MNKKKLLIGLGILVIVLIVIAIFKPKKGSESELEVNTSKVEKRNIVEIVSATGTIQPEKEVKISPEVPGEIIELNVKEGDKVKAGRLLVRLNPDLYEASVSRAEAGLNSARANVANSKARLEQAKARLVSSQANYTRQKKLYNEGVISQSEYDVAESDYRVAKAEVEAAEESLKSAKFNMRSAEATLKEARDNLRRTMIYSPMDGTVSKLSVELGERVVGTAQMAGTEMMRIADLTRMEVNVEVNESDIVRVKIGDEADIEVDAYIDRKFKGVVTEIANSSSSSAMQGSSNITVFNVKVSILKSSYQDLIDPENTHLSPFRPGMSASVDIITAKKDSVLSVPVMAVTLRPDSVDRKSKFGKIDLSAYEDDELHEVVFIYDAETGKAIKRKVTTGIQNTKYIEIVSGVENGETVISGPYDIVSRKLTDGAKVSPKNAFGESKGGITIRFGK